MLVRTALSELPKDQRRVIRFDLPAFGLTGPEPHNDYAIATYVRLVLAVMRQGLPVVVALNMADMAVRRGVHVDPEALARELGMPPYVVFHDSTLADMAQAARLAAIPPEGVAVPAVATAAVHAGALGYPGTEQENDDAEVGNQETDVVASPGDAAQGGCGQVDHEGPQQQLHPDPAIHLPRCHRGAILRFVDGAHGEDHGERENNEDRELQRWILGYYDCERDIFLTDDEARAALALD